MANGTRRIPLRAPTIPSGTITNTTRIAENTVARIMKGSVIRNTPALKITANNLRNR